MAELKTKKNGASVEDFINSITDENKRTDSFTLLELMKKITKEEPAMWGTSIIGFGSYHYVYESGRDGEWFKIGFSPRKDSLTLYLMSGFSQHEVNLNQLGQYKLGKGCLYIKKLENVDMSILKKILVSTVKTLKS